jgi:hypothetical protein
MHRRALIVSLGSVLAGCLSGSPGNQSTDAPPASSTPTSSPTESSPSPTTPTESATPDSEYRITDVSVTTSTEQPSVNYVLEPRAFYSADAVERERRESSEEVVVVDIADVDDPAVRQAIETAIREKEWRSNTLPDGLADLVERVDFVTGVTPDQTHTHVGLELYRLDPDRSPPVEFDASVPDGVVSTDNPGTLEFTLRNTGTETQELFSGTVPPFGIMRAERSSEDGRFLLWRDYEEEGCVFFTDEGIGSCDIGITTELEPETELSRRYDVLPATTEHYPDRTVPPGPGEYQTSEKIGYSTGDGAPGSTLSFTVDFTLDG